MIVPNVTVHASLGWLFACLTSTPSHIKLVQISCFSAHVLWYWVLRFEDVHSELWSLAAL